MNRLAWACERVLTAPSLNGNTRAQPASPAFHPTLRTEAKALSSPMPLRLKTGTQIPLEQMLAQMP